MVKRKQGFVMWLIRFPTNKSGFDRVSSLGPAPKASIDADHMAISHLLQGIGRQYGAKATAAIEEEFSVRARITGLDIALYDALAEVAGTRQMTLGPLALLADINQVKGTPLILPAFYLVHIGLGDLATDGLDQSEETGTVLHKGSLLSGMANNGGHDSQPGR